MSLHHELEEERHIIEAATAGPWDSGQGASGNPTDGPDHVAVRHGRDTIATLDLAAEAMQDAEFIAHARTALPLRNAQVDAVLALHKPEAIRDRSASMTRQECRADLDVWPCATVRAIEEAGA